ncbi:hypothetical protein P7H50_01535 [Enterococcus durans]|uniref:hypothetical protein n=1 Tax=Enterococcus durans TaxID=53345 RepID=UPI00288EBB15|nr:hypothetical protein [Enterococcus durans]MDT2835593.1 hypothetical protein [Enterococcus durans]
MNLKKVIVAFVAVLISSASFIFAGVNVYATEAASSESSGVQARQQITNDMSTEATASEIAEMKFYFEDVGHFNFEDHTYQVTNLEALTQKMQLNTDEGILAKSFYENVVAPNMQRKPIGDYLFCVAVNSIPVVGGIIYDYISGTSRLQTLVNALKSHNYSTAISLLKQVAAQYLKPADFARLNWVTIAASAAINAVSCL